MSLGYAEKLSYREDLGGQLGSRELNDRAEDVIKGVEQLAAWVRLCCRRRARRRRRRRPQRMQAPTPRPL
jgi:hypothetical protein